jgi:mannose-6-phosphate isomerase-like protein (cupin superfamily)
MPETATLDGLEQTPHAEVFDQRRPRTGRLELDAEQRIPSHPHPGKDIVLRLLSGRLELSLDDEAHDLHPNELIRFSGEREVSPYAVEQSTALLVFALSTDG